MRRDKDIDDSPYVIWECFGGFAIAGFLLIWELLLHEMVAVAVPLIPWEGNGG